MTPDQQAQQPGGQADPRGNGPWTQSGNSWSAFQKTVLEQLKDLVSMVADMRVKMATMEERAGVLRQDVSDLKVRVDNLESWKTEQRISDATAKRQAAMIGGIVAGIPTLILLVIEIVRFTQGR